MPQISIWRSLIGARDPAVRLAIPAPFKLRSRQPGSGRVREQHGQDVATISRSARSGRSGSTLVRGCSTSRRAVISSKTSSFLPAQVRGPACVCGLELARGRGPQHELGHVMGQSQRTAGGRIEGLHDEVDSPAALLVDEAKRFYRRLRTRLNAVTRVTVVRESARAGGWLVL